MNLKDIVAISGVGGLHKIIGRTKNGLILESLNESKKRFPTSMQDKVSVLQDISMYTEDGDMPLAEVLVKLHEKGNVPTPKDNAKIQRQFLVDVIKLESDRVYDSDIKKLLVWYNTLKDVLDFSTLLKSEVAAENTNETTTEEVKTEVEEKPKKSTKAAAPKKAAKTAAPKAPKVSSKSTSNANTYRPKSV
ncbi:MAG: hypothetical protein EAY81_12220 [Bacteroidetes bacterium]|nr:MAG: hypothetical protein EAY81_12220 [Bacteroidota bacterium]